jgi:hypothetical protein
MLSCPLPTYRDWHDYNRRRSLLLGVHSLQTHVGHMFNSRQIAPGDMGIIMADPYQASGRCAADYGAKNASPASSVSSHGQPPCGCSRVIRIMFGISSSALAAVFRAVLTANSKTSERNVPVTPLADCW